MKVFLLAVAGVVVGIVLLAGLAWLWLRRKLAGAGRALGVLAASLNGVPPFRITLVPLNVAPWEHADDVRIASISLESVGYRRLDDFEVVETKDVLLRGFWHPERRSYAVVYDHAIAGVIVDVVGLHTDRSLLTVTSGPETGLDRPDRSPLLRMRIRDLAEVNRLHIRLLEETAGRTPLATTPAEFSRAIEGAYRMEMDWRITRGGVTAAEVRGAAEAGGQEPPDDCAVERVQAGWRSAIADFVGGEVLKTWLASNPMPAADWEERRERIRVVHDHCDADELSDELAYAMIAGQVDDEDDEAEECAHGEAKARLAPVFGGSVCAGFAAAQELLPEKQRFRKIGAVAKPFAGDLWLEADAETLS